MGLSVFNDQYRYSQQGMLQCRYMQVPRRLDDLSGQHRPASISSSGTPFHEAKTTLSGKTSGLKVASIQKGSCFEARWIEVKCIVSGSLDRGALEKPEAPLHIYGASGTT